MSKATDAQIDRINELSQLARTAWFSLLGYLVFVGITLLGVRDADFFVPSRQTDLPLVNVAIPTASFFWIAPILGAALYTYLHLFLIKLWDAHADARTADDDATHHWLVGDFVLIRQRDPVARARPLAFLTDWITRLLVWAAAPIVLAYAWWRSMPAHNEWLTLLIALCLWVSLVVGFTSWWRAEERLGRSWPGPKTTFWRQCAAGLAALVLVTLSWLRTEGGLDRYVAGTWTLDTLSFTVPANTPIVRWFTTEDWLLPLARTDLAGEVLVDLPADWRAPDVAEAAFRETWCRREGLEMLACDQPAGPDHDTPAPVADARSDWCAENGSLPTDACTGYFADLDRRFAEAWGEERRSARAALPELDLRGRDLRRAAASRAALVGANLSGAQLEGAVLIQAQMEGADLSGAQMEGAVLSRAQMEGAVLTQAQMEGAVLIQAQMEGADLSGAHMEGANLSVAQMEGADLSRAQMEGADLTGAQMEGANLCWAQMEGAVLIQAQMEGADLLWAQMEGADLSEAQMEGAVLIRAQMERADLRWAQMEGADLRWAQMEGANLRWAQMEGAVLIGSDLRRSEWPSASNRATPAHFADLRGAQGLTQGLLEELIGNPDTLLPDRLSDAGAPLYVWSCWETPPPGFDALVARVGPESSDAFLCGREPRHRTGKPHPVDQPRPPGHSLGPGD